MVYAELCGPRAAHIPNFHLQAWHRKQIQPRLGGQWSQVTGRLTAEDGEFAVEFREKQRRIKGETDYRPRLDAWDKPSDLVLWEDLEGAGGEGGGRGDRDGEDMWTHVLFISMYDKIHYK